MVDVAVPELSERDRAILAFEHAWWDRFGARHFGSKDNAIREAFGLGTARYYQLLNRIIDEPAALAHDPIMVIRLQEARERRAAERQRRAFD